MVAGGSPLSDPRKPIPPEPIVERISNCSRRIGLEAPNICTFTPTKNGQTFIAMRLLEGQTIRQRISVAARRKAAVE
jgi:hypothetical protein